MIAMTAATNRITPTAIQVNNLLVDEFEEGEVIGNVSVADPDEGDTHTFTVSDPRFEVVGDQLNLTRLRRGLFLASGLST